jgi:ankyrin repeat protein
MQVLPTLTSLRALKLKGMMDVDVGWLRWGSLQQLRSLSLDMDFYEAEYDAPEIVSHLKQLPCEDVFLGSGASALHVAAETGDVEYLRRVWDSVRYRHPQHTLIKRIDALDDNDMTPLAYAIRHQHLAVVEYLLAESGASAATAYEYVALIVSNIIAFFATGLV